MIRTTSRVLLGVVAGMLFAAMCFADTAQVLPKGEAAVNVTYHHYFDIDQRFDPDGDKEDVAANYNADLNRDIFPALAILDPVVGGNATIGRSVVDITMIYRYFEISLYYGLTNKLSIGIHLPVYYAKAKVKARLDTSTANVGKNPASPVGVAPLSVPGTVPLSTEDVQDLLSDGLDVNDDGIPEVPGFGYDRFATWSGWNLNDMELLAKYQFYNKAPWRLAFTGGTRLPTGEVDDPDNLVDLRLGDGQTDILLRSYVDYLGVTNLLLNLTLRYDIQLPDKQTKRVLLDANNPLSLNKEKVDRNLGDVFELEAFANYNLTNFLSMGVKYRFTQKLHEDDIDGDLGFNYEALEDESKISGHMFFAKLGFSTVQLYLQKKFPVPFSFDVAYRNRFAGRNNVSHSEYVSLSLTAFF